MKVVGVDFSGARDAGKRIWITEGRLHSGQLRLDTCYQASAIWCRRRDACLEFLVRRIASERSCVVGLDFPFGIPRPVAQDTTWAEFVRGFTVRYATPHDFKQSCHSAAKGRELRRQTDVESHTPFSPYNLRVYRQTYYGIAQVLAPLVSKEHACVIPMQRPIPGLPWVIEICPASTLRCLGLYTSSYKGPHASHLTARATILDALATMTGADVSSNIRVEAEHDVGGDALDSAIAAVAVARAVAIPANFIVASGSAYPFEGLVST